MEDDTKMVPIAPETVPCVGSERSSVLREYTAADRVKPFVDPETGLPMIAVRADILGPALVYMRKLFTSIQGRTATNVVPSRFVDPEDYEMGLHLMGFTPEDFNAAQSLVNTMVTDVKELVDEAAKRTPQMKRTNEFGMLKSGDALLQHHEVTPEGKKFLDMLKELRRFNQEGTTTGRYSSRPPSELPYADPDFPNNDDDDDGGYK